MAASSAPISTRLTTKQNPAAAPAPDLVNRKFTATARNQLWVADVTYVPTVQGWLYLARVTDIYSRIFLNWAMASYRKTDLVVDAITSGQLQEHVPFWRPRRVGAGWPAACWLSRRTGRMDAQGTAWSGREPTIAKAGG
jgi:transposase InsO family protein